MLGLGELMRYATNLTDNLRRSVTYVDKKEVT
jgi:hypothetical protein